MRHELVSKRDEISELCRRYGVTQLDVVGSGARGDDYDPERSDFDFLVEFATVTTMSPLVQLFGLARALEGLLGRPVDLIERGGLKNPFVRASLEAAREEIYAA